MTVVMKRMFLLTNNWPNSLMSGHDDSMGVVVEDEALAKEWLKQDKFNSYELVEFASSVEEVGEASKRRADSSGPHTVRQDGWGLEGGPVREGSPDDTE